MTELEKWFVDIIKQKDKDEISWFLHRPSLKQAREREMTELA